MNMKTHNNVHSAQFYTLKSESDLLMKNEETQEHSFKRAASSEAVTKIQGK